MDVKTSNQIIATCPWKHHSLLEAAISALGMIPRILGSRSSFRHLVITEEPHRLYYSDNLLHFFFRLLLYSFPGGEIFGA